MHLLLRSKNYLMLATMALIGITSNLWGDVKILSSDDLGVTFRYTPDIITSDLTDGVVTLTLKNIDVQPNAQSVLIPVKNVTVAVPPESNPTVKLLNQSAGESWNGHLPVAIDENSLPELTPTFLSQNYSTIGEYEARSFAGYNTIRVPLYPVTTSNSPPRVNLAGEIVVRVEFNSTPTTSSYRPIPPTRHSKDVIINTTQASKWGKNQTSSFINTPDEAWPQGFLYDFIIDKEGIYRLTFEELRAKGVVELGSGIPSSNIKLYGNGGKELPLDPGTDVVIGLLECAIQVEDGGDGSFDPGDWILFYGKGAGGWETDPEYNWVYRIHHYDTDNIYWFNIDPAGGGKRMSSFHADQVVDRSVDFALTRDYREDDLFIYGSSNFIGTGREWYGYTLDGPSQIAFNLNATGMISELPASLRMRVVNAYGGSGSPRIELRTQLETIDSFTPGTYTLSSVRTISDMEDYLAPGYNTLIIEQLSSGNRVMIDWMDLSYYSKLDRNLFFQTPAANEVIEYRTTTSFDPWIFDISEHNDTKLERRVNFNITTSLNESHRLTIAGENNFLRVGSQFHEYFPESSDFEVTDPWSETNSYDVLLIVPDGYWDAVEPLIEHYSRRDTPLRGAAVRLSEINNRFAGGVSDPAAIRNMLMYAQDYWIDPPDYVVFCGDGDFNYRDIGRPKKNNQLPPYEMGTMCSDDWFVDFTSDASSYPLPEMVTGRLTASGDRGAYDLQNMITKIIEYDENPDFGPWRNRVTLVADDEFGERYNSEDEHVVYSEELSSRYIPSTFDRVKIYLTEYEREWGRQKPKAGDDLVASINRGTLLVNYMGHGNPTLWAHEHVFVMSRDLSRIELNRKQALYLAFTCDWAYWDDPNGQSFPELLLSMPDRGAIAVIASTRLTWGGSNRSLARNYFNNQFYSDTCSMGEALFLGKHQARGPNSATYHLLGDPTLHLGIPELKGRFVSLDPYPLTPLASSQVSGEIFYNDNQLNTDFSGKVEFILLDTEVPRLYLVTSVYLDGSVSYIPLRYNLPGPMIYRGDLSVSAGVFQGQFIVPKDVTLGGELGKAVGYFHNETIDGVMADTVVYANYLAATLDNEPPQIQIYFDHRSFRTGDRIGPDPLLIVDLYDSSGLNLTGAMGHGITCTIDNGTIINLTSHFRYDLDSYQSGSLEKTLNRLEPGLHTIEVQAWDSYNNLSVKQLEIEVTNADESFLVDNVLNWPNPFKDQTQLTFISNRPADYEILIYTTSGRLVWDYKSRLTTAGIASDAVWDGHDKAGRQVGNGVYLYKIKAWDEQGNLAEGLGKIVYAR